MKHDLLRSLFFQVVPANSALRIRAILDFETDDGEKRVAGDEWLFEGPGEWLFKIRLFLKAGDSKFNIVIEHADTPNASLNRAVELCLEDIKI